uniref:G-protein coupled receptors family 1 profile domain-containing protein n=1 Tax=Sus scrofa TaxID=9823 RepID=A0A8D0TCF8_PIG
MSCGVGHRCCLNLALLWLWRRPKALIFSVSLSYQIFTSVDMDVGNRTILTEFILMMLFGIFLTLYLVTLSGNMTLVILICIDSCLYTPICVSDDKRISMAGCGAQLFFSCVVAYTECYLLAAMAYDHHMVICNPLLDSSSMSDSLCTALIAGSYIGGFLNVIAHTANTFRLSFCGKNIIDHFFCDAPPLVKMSCTDTHVYEKVLLGVVGFTFLSSILAILISYFNILLALLRIHTASGRCKAFPTCDSHLISVMLFYGSLLFTYSRPSSTYSLGRDKVASLFYTVVNPLLYSVRNKDVKEAFWKTTQIIRSQR